MGDMCNVNFNVPWNPIVEILRDIVRIIIIISWLVSYGLVRLARF